jgi:hypothetical protein
MIRCPVSGIVVKRVGLASLNRTVDGNVPDALDFVPDVQHIRPQITVGCYRSVAVITRARLWHRDRRAPVENLRTWNLDTIPIGGSGSAKFAGNSPPTMFVLSMVVALISTPPGDEEVA